MEKYDDECDHGLGAAGMLLQGFCAFGYDLMLKS
jgi:hypothetical protein